MRRTVILTVILVIVFTPLGLFLIASPANSPASQTSPAPQSTPGTLRPPTDLFASGTGDGAVLLSWQPAHPAPVGYRIYRATSRHGPYTIVGSVNSPLMDTFTDGTDLAPGMTYAYTVTSFDRRGESAPVGPIVAIVVAAQPTRAPAVPSPLPTFQAPAAATLTALAQATARRGPSPTPASGIGVGPTPLPTIPPSTAVATATRHP